MKRIVVLAAVLIAISTVSVNAAATTVPESAHADSIAPYYETAFDAVSTLTISGKTVKCESKLRGHSDVKSCKVVQTLIAEGAPTENISLISYLGMDGNGLTMTYNDWYRSHYVG